jgi:hypothetical protein
VESINTSNTSNSFCPHTCRCSSWDWLWDVTVSYTAARGDTLLARVCAHLSVLLMFAILACAGWLPHLLLHNALPALCFAGFVYYVESLWTPLGNLLADPFCGNQPIGSLPAFLLCSHFQE